MGRLTKERSMVLNFLPLPTHMNAHDRYTASFRNTRQIVFATKQMAFFIVKGYPFFGKGWRPIKRTILILLCYNIR